MAYNTPATWLDRDDLYYSPPPEDSDPRYRDYHEDSCPKIIRDISKKKTIGNFCGFLCYVGWKFGKKLFCDHNKACCLRCGETWVRFGAPKSHMSLTGDVMFNGVGVCHESPRPEVESVLSFYGQLESQFEESAVPIMRLLEDPSEHIHPCTTNCLRDFGSGFECSHRMKYCSECSETYFRTYESCPWHTSSACELDMNEFFKMPSHTTALTTHKIFNFFDDSCDDECTYLHHKDIASICRHNLTRCRKCNNCWDGMAQCNCYMHELNPPSSDDDNTSLDGEASNEE